ncbi:flotillin domain protein [Talaromyces stipitatus ATCC 10500]|uniref:Flotillin domain protein n=1 Tax=Talaromyces stipitatus (strain ATCC 10500 / CBS 375.48 / QM 6759 / NRRL 1006) TaxID=441959 RepID=B8M1F1_TALSN|nr:flotillin domain protein [Talaromyces stipitatus ATCC 10500]EED21847.1 flotillin domain protein [Talaromyces stipitatus ATCC 10500]
MRYYIASANEYLVITGAGIPDLRICKKALVYPWQKISRISVTPFDFSLNLQAMTVEKLQFALPAVFTIGPDNELDALKKYALLLSGNADGTSEHKYEVNQPARRNHVQDIVKGIIEGETRVIVSSMTMEEIFKERQIFKAKVIENVQNELQQFGLRIYNANVKELQDTPGSEYFAFLSRKAHEGALNQAKIDVAEARMRGEIGEAEKKGRTKQEISKIDAETAVLETKRKAEKAKADSELTSRQIELERDIRMAKISAERQTEMRDAELRKNVESKRAETELERLRATDVTKSKIAREAAQEKADAAFYTEQKAADASFYKKKMESDAYYYRQRREAEAIQETAKAYKSMVDTLGGPQGFLQLKMIETGMYERLAQANATAVSGMQPKITTWNTGSSAGEADSTASIRNIMQSLPPLLSTIHEQTGIAPPTWFAQMPQAEANGALVAPKKVNGN